MISTVLARRYAKALFAVAKEEDSLETYNKAIQAIGTLLAENPDVESALESPVVPPDIKEEIAEYIIKAVQVEESLANFLRLLVERRRIQHLRIIAESFQELMDEEMGVIRARVVTAVPLPAELKKKVAEVLSEVTGKTVALVTEEDPTIIGGVVAHVGDMVWDGSIRSQLQGFKESIGRGEIG